MELTARSERNKILTLLEMLSAEMRCLWILFVITSCMTYAFWEKRRIEKNNLYSGSRKIKGVVEGDIILPKFRNARRPSSAKWPNGTVPYKISNDFTVTQHNTIMTAMAEIEINTRFNVTNCITFVERTTEADYLDIQRNKWGCASFVGRIGGAQLFTVSDDCSMKGAVMHELIHALGFYHEHNRYDRDKYITVHISNIAVGGLPEFHEETNRTMNLLRTSYDFGSLMHYGAYQYALNKSLPTITPVSVRKSAGVTMGQQYTMSKNDVERIQRLYKCKIDTSHIIMFQTVFRCSFDTDLCKLQQDTQDDFDWKSQVSGRATFGTRPVADFTNGVGSYIYAEVKAHRGKKARLLTPTFGRGQYCIHFGIYLHKPQKGVFKILGTGPKITEHIFITILSIYEARWREFLIDMMAPSNFRLILQAEIGDGDGSDIAIDEFALHRGVCTDLVY